MHPDDTIVAISSPPGRAWRGIVRLSGPHAISIANQVFTSTSGRLDSAWSNRREEGHVLFGARRFPASAIIFHAPHSYTRQDTVELHLLGAPVLLGMLVESCISAGARRADPGEFTARAYLSGAMEWSEVHGIAGIIAARSDSQLRAAEQLLRGSLSKTAGLAREQLAELLSLVEGAMDFADEPIEFITPEELCQRLESVHDALAATMSAASRTERWDRLPNVVLVGLPNAGKSSLFNKLTGLNRVIAAPVAGTTRDTVTAPLIIGAIECLLIDSPGLMQNASGLDANAVAQTQLAIRDADLIVEVVDVTQDTPPPVQYGGNTPVIRVGNKADLLNAQPGQSLGIIDPAGTGFLGTVLTGNANARRPNILVSALTGHNCNQLKALIGFALHEHETDAHDSAIAMMSEHRDALEVAIAAIERAILLARKSSQSLINADLVALELHAAADGLGLLVGQDQTEEMLGRIFARFCVGK